MEIKYYTILNNTYEEIPYGNLPSVLWEDSNTHKYRTIIDNMVFSLRNKSVFISGVLEMLPFNTNEWLKKSDVILTVTENTYRNLTTLQIENQPFDENNLLKPNIISEFDFFVLMIGHNVNQLPLSLYYFVVDAIIRKYKL